MSNNENQGRDYKIYLKFQKEWLPVTKQQFNDYYRGINAYRKKEQEHGRCVCPASKRYLCDIDCGLCEFRRAGDTLSLDFTNSTENGGEFNWIETLSSNLDSTQKIIEDAEFLHILYRKLETLTSDEQDICQMIMFGKSEREIANKIGISRNTYTYRRDKLFAELKNFLKKHL